MAVANPRSGHGKKLDKLRLIVAEAIFCNAVNRDSEPTDISRSAAAHELYGQYCLKICLNWLATRYGFPIYTLGINPRFHAVYAPLDSWPQLADRYPLNTPDTVPLPESAWEKAFAYLNQNFEPSFELIGKMYMHFLSTRHRGEFYTPPWLVDYCVDLAWTDGAPRRLLDPACGSGNFLIGAIKHARLELAESDLLEFAKQSLYGYDIDGCAASLARFSVLLALAAELRRPDDVVEISKSLNANIRVTDSLVETSSLHHFDIVIGNPPYLSFGARNQPVLPESSSRYLRATYEASSEYKIRLHSVFQQIAIDLIGPKGNVVLLVPDAFLNGAYYKKLRRYITENSQIVTLCELPESTFTDAVVGKWCVAHYRKPADNRAVTLHRANTVAGERSFETYKLKLDQLVSADKHRFQLVFRDDDLEILESLSQCAPLSKFIRGHTGMRSRNGQQTIVAERAKSEHWRRGLNSGSAVTQHHVEWQGKWLNVDPQGLYAGGFDPGIIERPKILMRQTADRIVAAVDLHGFYHLNNLHSFAACSSFDAAEHFLFYVAGLMNSSFWLYLYQLRTREAKRALAQIDIETIESMPVPSRDIEREILISRLVQQLMALSNPSSKEASALRTEIDAHIYEMYGIAKPLATGVRT